MLSSIYDLTDRLHDCACILQEDGDTPQERRRSNPGNCDSRDCTQAHPDFLYSDAPEYYLNLITLKSDNVPKTRNTTPIINNIIWIALIIPSLKDVRKWNRSQNLCCQYAVLFPKYL